MYIDSIPSRKPSKTCTNGWSGAEPWTKYPITNTNIHATKTPITYLPSRDPKSCEIRLTVSVPSH